jgi:hypothetical protein
MRLKLMDFQLNNYKTAYFLLLIILSCSCNTVKHNFYYSYSLQIKQTPITCALNTAFGCRYEESGMIVSLVKKDSIEVWNIENNKKVCSFLLKNELQAQTFQYIFIEDSVHLFFLNSSLLIFNRGTWSSKILKLPYGCLPQSALAIKYINEINSLFFSVLDTNKIKDDSLLFTLYSLATDESSIIKVQCPSIYKNRIGVPKYFLSYIDKHLTISFEYSKKVIIFDNILNKRNVSKELEVISTCNVLKPKSLDASDLSVKYDVLKKNRIEGDFYGICFFDSINNSLIRSYKISLPEKDQYNNFFTLKRQGINFIKQDLHSNTKKEYKLPLGQYFGGDKWYFNKFTSDINIIKFNENDTKNDKWNISVHRITLYDF